MAQSLAEIMASLNPEYDPQRALVQKQQAALPGEQQAVLAGLDTAKTNSFNDITNQANARGVVYSGAPIAEQQRYVGEKYLPAYAGVKSDYANRGGKLEAALLDVNRSQSERAQQMRDTQIGQDLAAQQLADQRARAAQANQGLDLGSLFGPTPQQQQQAAASDPHAELLADISHFITPDWAKRYLPGFTERTLIPKLQKEYPELAAKIPDLVYQYRKQYETRSPTSPTGKNFLGQTKAMA